MTYHGGSCIKFVLAASILASLIDPSFGDCRVLADCDGGQARWESLVPGKQGIPGPIGPKGDPGPGVNITELKEQLNAGDKEPKLYQDVPTLTWQSSKEFCGRLGRTLCSRDQICLQRNGGRELRRDVIPGDHWVAVTNAVNEWVQIGHYPVTPCTLHIAIWGPPSWGTSTVSSSHKGFIYCCHWEPKEYTNNDQSDIRYQYIGSAATYASSSEHCLKQGRKLCNSTQVCNSNKPVFGMITGNSWIAVSDKFNEWVQIGNSQGRTCKTHGNLPTWGVRTDGSQRGDVGYVYCCK